MTGGYLRPTTGVCWVFEAFPFPRGFDPDSLSGSLVRPGWTTISRSTSRLDMTGGYLLPTTGYTTLRAFPENHRPLELSKEKEKTKRRIGELVTSLASSSATTSVPNKNEVSESDPASALTGVWWDLNTCPVPVGFDPGCVRRCIESALRKFSGEPCRVIIYAIGNLEYISPDHLEAISSSGVILNHAPCGDKNLDCYLLLWSLHTPPPAKILLISSNPTWFDPSLVEDGYTAIRAFPESHRPSLVKSDDYTCIGEEWDWETLLKENSDKSVEETSLRMVIDEHVYGPNYYCFVCGVTCPSCSSFVRHLKSNKHKRMLFVSVAHGEKGLPIRYCEVCEYPGYDDNNMNIHYNSDEHKQNVLASQLEEERKKKKSIGELAPSLVSWEKLKIKPPVTVWGDSNAI